MGIKRVKSHARKGKMVKSYTAKKKDRTNKSAFEVVFGKKEIMPSEKIPKGCTEKDKTMYGKYVKGYGKKVAKESARIRKFGYGV